MKRFSKLNVKVYIDNENLYRGFMALKDGISQRLGGT